MATTPWIKTSVFIGCETHNETADQKWWFCSIFNQIVLMNHLGRHRKENI